MVENWSKTKEDWLNETSLPRDLAIWAMETIEGVGLDSRDIDLIQELNDQETDIRLQNIKKLIKKKISEKEGSLDEISLNAPNSYKLQLSLPPSLHYLMKAWAAAEGRDLSSVALHCLETGLRSLKTQGSIPSAVVKRYEITCEKRIALAEINKSWDRYEKKILNQKK